MVVLRKAKSLFRSQLQSYVLKLTDGEYFVCCVIMMYEVWLLRWMEGST